MISGYLESKFKFLRGGNAKLEELSKLKKRFKVALIERITVENQIIIMCAGIHGRETRFAVTFLAKNWKKLYSQTKGKDFVQLLWFKSPNHSDSIEIETIFEEYSAPVLEELLML